VKPPEVNDVNKYNHAVSALWIMAALVLEIIGIPLLFFRAKFSYVYFDDIWCCCFDYWND